MITCICITRGDRLDLLSDAMADFAGQSFTDRELLVVHDGGIDAQRAIEALSRAHPDHVIRVEEEASGQTLGALRNAGLARARGDWVCQWDDDDRYHPQRLQLQSDCARDHDAAVNYLVDQLHWFAAEGTLCWDDWSGEAYPLNLIQGTLLARRDVLPPYPPIARGEDTLQTHALLRAAASRRFGVSRLHDHGWCYVYRCHGGNVWDAAHHRAISVQKHRSAAGLLPRLDALRGRLAEYAPALPILRMPVGSSLVAVSDGDGSSRRAVS